MKKIYSQQDPEKLLHIICRKEELGLQGTIEGGRVDVAPEDQFLQVAAIQMNEGKTFKPHRHIWKDGEKSVIAQESWVVISGSVKATLYDLDDSIIAEEQLKAGDLSMTFQGGHNYLATEPNTFVYEFKTGPYKGVENDKTFIE
jgi:cupin fold WbuC family metalloprotein